MAPKKLKDFTPSDHHPKHGSRPGDHKPPVKDGDSAELRTFPSGANRSNDADVSRFDFIPGRPLHRVGVVMAQGAKVHGEHNWRQGTPHTVPINHALQHIYAFSEGDRSCDHLAHAVCNLLFLMEYQHTHPEMADTLVVESDRQPLNGVG